MQTPRWLLRLRLRRAANLLRNGILNRWQYSALAIELGYEIIGSPLQDGAKVDYFTFGVRLSERLVRDIGDGDEIRRSLIEYGPYNEATATLKLAQQELLWDSDQQNRARAAGLRLSPLHRGALRFQEWWGEQERVFPLFTKLTGFILGLVLGTIIGQMLP
jgi:hypothetical protein